MLLGCIADDFTGASDLANTLTANGMRTVQAIGVPASPIDADAVVVALKSRSIAAEDAVAQSLAALAWLQANGATQILFKYCSTFDSTPDGNIGPVTQALLDRLGAPITIACPAFPTNKRTIYLGHLFVGDRLLNESGMQNHPLTPMTDANLVRWLQRQMPGKVGLLEHAVVARGGAAVQARLAQLAGDGVRVAVADAITDADLRALGAGIADLALVTGGSGIALGLPDNFRRRGQLAASRPEPIALGGPAVVLSGSCSEATRRQVTAYAAVAPARMITAEQICIEKLDADTIARWVLEQQHAGQRAGQHAGREAGQGTEQDAGQDAGQPDQGLAPLVYTSAEPAVVAAAQRRFGTEQVAQAIEAFTGALAQALHRQGVQRFIVAGGETSGAVVQALGVRQLAIGAEIDPGVPALRGVDVPVGLALKSGNFGADDFFRKALAQVA
ncbi:MAG: 3-oxo-tetronate kinase [Lautropia sp.]